MGTDKHMDANSILVCAAGFPQRMGNAFTAVKTKKARHVFNVPCL
jgi:hypothetical protein